MKPLTRWCDRNNNQINKNDLQKEIDNLKQEVFICSVYQFCDELEKFVENNPEAKDKHIKFKIELNNKDDLILMAMGQDFLEEPEWLDNIDDIFSQEELQIVTRNFPDSEEVDLNLNTKNINSLRDMLLGKDLLIALRHEQLEIDLKEKTNKSVKPKI